MTGANIEDGRGGRIWDCERNKIGKILRKIGAIDLIRIEIIASEKQHIFGIGVPGCAL